MFIIFGLGNPGPQYHGTRHNAGFELVDLIADQANIDINRNKFKSMVGEGFFAGKKVILIKPMTYMNLSGEAVVAALNFYKPAPDEWMVAYDDMDLKPGAVRVREKGSSGGHNGMKSIIALTGSDEFIRLRIGVGGARGNVISHVLGKFNEDEEKPYTEGLLLAREAVKTIMAGRVEDAMSQVNSSGKPPKKPRIPRREAAAQAADTEAADAKAAATGAAGSSEAGPSPDQPGMEPAQPAAPGQTAGEISGPESETRAPKEKVSDHEA
ncbi:MAG TPA: aminoacyl-tRNA hydrolase [Thioalkalivibrio sp.]|nr:aminoacyl-tRNA hydrolase [Thioalkalivibrio sp.]